MIRILVCDDHPVVRAGLAAVFAGAEDLHVIAEVATATEAIALAHEADVVTMDLRLGDGTDGAEATRRIRALDHPPAVLVLTNYDDDADILAAVEAGAAGYLLKDAPPEQLLSATRRAARGESVLGPELMSRLRARQREAHVDLTPRERDVLERLETGASNKEIAAELFLSPTTVKSHLAAIYGKLGVPSRTAAIAKAREQGLLR
ncbi:DNA-binding response regulator [Gulosibacter macacae]|uniref:DNA-binding response regulator n=1 Tax=Gulosibacter macacae TaxID=2488791 RepID=A0A3P3VZ74_9MICO|nr:response regulator transcription factor [Gulosibacter macacae]RRJ87794.1 DNA-binding response regulator [Gulosibacter macacae]